MLPANPTRAGTPLPQSLCSRRDFLIFCLGFVGVSCASAGVPSNAPLTAALSPPVTVTPTATAPVPYRGIYTGHGGLPVWSVAWSPDGRRIASGGVDTTVQIWDAMTDRTLLTYRGHTQKVQVAAWSPNGRQIASGSDDTTVQIWDAMTGRLQLTYRGHTDEVHDVVWSPNGQRISSGSDDHTAQVWEATTGKHQLTYQGHSSYVMRVPWSPNGQRIASASWPKMREAVMKCKVASRQLLVVSSCYLFRPLLSCLERLFL